LTGGSVADAVPFQTPRAVYLIHVIGPIGTFTFPADTGKATFEVFGPDHDWLAGEQRAPGSGTLTIDAKNTGGRFDVQLTDISTSHVAPATVHASGTWVCTG